MLIHCRYIVASSQAWKTGRASAFCDRGQQLFHRQVSRLDLVYDSSNRFCPPHMQSNVHPHMFMPGLPLPPRRRLPCLVAYVTCSMTRLSATSWLHGSRNLSPFCLGSQMTAPPSMTTGSFVSFWKDCTSIAHRKVNSSSFYALTRGKLCEFPGMTAVLKTRLRTPFTRFFHVAVFKESSL